MGLLAVNIYIPVLFLLYQLPPRALTVTVLSYWDWICNVWFAGTWLIYLCLFSPSLLLRVQSFRITKVGICLQGQVLNRICFAVATSTASRRARGEHIV